MRDFIWICERKLHLSTLEREWCVECDYSRPVPMKKWVPLGDAKLMVSGDDIDWGPPGPPSFFDPDDAL